MQTRWLVLLACNVDRSPACAPPSSCWGARACGASRPENGARLRARLEAWEERACEAEPREAASSARTSRSSASRVSADFRFRAQSDL